MADTNAWTDLVDWLHEYEALEGAMALLGWDQQTMMPRKSAGSRGSQLALLAKYSHEHITHPNIGEWLDQLGRAELDEVQAATVRNLRRVYSRATRVPARLVTELAEAQTTGFEAWMKAKQSSNFSVFAAPLQRLVDLTKERVSLIDSARHPFDVLLDDYDPGTTVATLRPMFGRLRDELTRLLGEVSQRPQQPTFTPRFSTAEQQALAHDVLSAFGFDLDAGRLDESEHPFSVGMHPTDVRITAHYYEDDLITSIGGVIHEGGHGMYEQGLPMSLRGTFAGRAASFGLHESQSRFWENFVGRSRPFFEWFAGRVRERAPGRNADPDAMYRAANRVTPGLIRIKADEVTYNLHIIVRFEIEVALFEGRLSVADLPEAWNARYREYLGITPTNDGQGVLQDVHWSGAAFGYFPSYTLGNLYAASLGAALEREQPDLWSRIAVGDFAPILAWLRKNVHSRAHLADAPDIVRTAVGERDHVEDLVRYLWGRHGQLYGVAR